MKYLIKLNELINASGDKSILNKKHLLDDYIFILFKGRYWLLNDENFKKNLKNTEVSKIITDIDSYDDIHELVTTIAEEHPYILMGIIRKGVLYINDYGQNFHHTNTSEDIKKIINELKIPVKYIIRQGKHLEREEEISMMYDNIKDTTFYHGTSMEHLESILKKGLIPNPSSTNFKEIYHRDKVFLAKSLEKVLFHAKTSSVNTDSFPILIEVKIPDLSKVILDYDTVIEFYGKDSNIAQKLEYDISAKNYIRHYWDLNEENFGDLIKKFGIIGYKGRIPPSHILNICLDLEYYERYYIEKEYDIINLDFDSEIWDDISLVSYWDKVNPNEILNKLNEIEEDVEEEFRGEVEDDFE